MRIEVALLQRPDVSVLVPYACKHLVRTAFHNTDSVSLTIREFTIVHILFGRPLEAKSALVSLVQHLVLPASQVDLACVMPHYGNVVGNYQDAVIVSFDAHILFMVDL
jgi:hypothetical protein